MQFARYLHEVPPAAGADSSQLRAFLDGLAPGEPPDGRRYLHQAFTHYTRAVATTDEQARGQLLLLANVEIGMHEQTRLQPEIREALDAPYDVKQDLGGRLLLVLAPWWRRPVPRVLAKPAGVLGARAQRGLADMLREIITRSLMVISLPGRVLYLGAHLEEPFPAALAELTDAELSALLGSLEPKLPTVDDAGARDWADFDQRMHYVAHLFRAFHLHEELRGPPFTVEQVKAFTAGTIPDGEL